MKGIKCYIEDHYKIDHSQVSELARTTFATVGSLFNGKPVCSWCIARLTLVADAYNHQRGNIRGNAINVDVKVGLDELIKRSPLKSVFEDYDLADIKFNLDKNLFELEPKTAIQPSMQSEMDRIAGARTIREL
ncbi:hypothetical protein ACFLX4_01115 [Chloroflexota bacterium]